MSGDYAAIVTTIVLAVLVVGSVQLYVLAQRELIPHSSYESGSAAELRIVGSIREGNPPRAEDLATLDATTRSGVPLKVIPTRAFVVLWVIVCFALIVVEIKVLKWAASAKPGPAPELAAWSFYVCAGSVMLLAVEGLARAMAPALTVFLKSAKDMWSMSREERDQVKIALADYRAAQNPSPPAADEEQPSADDPPRP
ncbi:hypothetical protein [Streptomyces sp. NPDC056632]|uniref:hypothetical protein n=1 Tax=Streptomyces sp. NPDC056632 TaxID=3345884 RepID=UPI003690BBF4